MPPTLRAYSLTLSSVEGKGILFLRNLGNPLPSDMAY